MVIYLTLSAELLSVMAKEAKIVGPLLRDDAYWYQRSKVMTIDKNPNTDPKMSFPKYV
jgi:hypothetical protein